jgi:hypothetical protein
MRATRLGGCGCLAALLLWATLACPAEAWQPCRVEVVDPDGWPVPGVELRTVHGLRFVSDNAGLIAIDTPDLFGRETWFEIIGHGYGVDADGFGNRGMRLVPEDGAMLKVEVKRSMPARRIGRLTGGGLFAESRKLGERQDHREAPLLGCDSVFAVDHGGRRLWFWGDTQVARYPLGNFHMTAAETPLNAGFTDRPPLDPSYRYFTEPKARGEQDPRGVCRLDGEGPTWASGMVSLPDRHGARHLVAVASKIRGLLEAYRIDAVEWDDSQQSFRPLTTLWTKAGKDDPIPPMPEGHPVPWTDASGRAWILFCNPFPKLRCPATYEGWLDRTQWEPLDAPDHATRADGGKVRVHSGNCAWHPWLKRWLAVFVERDGKPSSLGEVWLAGAPGPFGPWTDARKVVTHDNYTFYNPRLHHESFRADSPVVLFEGTYTALFSTNTRPTPRWDYNQVLYRVELEDRR